MLSYILRNNLRAVKAAIALRKQKQKQVFELTLNGGFGDVILDSQFLLALRDKYPKADIKVYYRDDHGDSDPDPSNFSWGKTRHYTTIDGGKANPITEWLDALCCTNSNVGCCIDVERGIRVYPESVHKLFSGYWRPEKFNKLVNQKVFETHSKSISQVLLQYEAELFGDEVPVVALHLRRNASKIMAMAEEIQQHIPNVRFALLGSSEHQDLPSIDGLNDVVSLIDSYTKGLGTLDVLYLSRKSNLFIGGRGGFELFHWLSEVPSICFFDEMGLQEVRQLWWHPSLWEDNKINKLYLEDSDLSTIWSHVEKASIFK